MKSIKTEKELRKIIVKQIALGSSGHVIIYVLDSMLVQYGTHIPISERTTIEEFNKLVTRCTINYITTASGLEDLGYDKEKRSEILTFAMNHSNSNYVLYEYLLDLIELINNLS
jgi:hypothetical protein